MREGRELMTTLTLQEDFPKGSRVEGYLRMYSEQGTQTTYEIELVPVRTEHVGVTEDKGAELALPVPDHHHIQDGDVLTITLPEFATQKDRAEAQAVLRSLVSSTRAMAGLVLNHGQGFGTQNPREVMRARSDGV
jgi:hypothetical protein